jgi:hypothetical protein
MREAVLADGLKSLKFLVEEVIFFVGVVGYF